MPRYALNEFIVDSTFDLPFSQMPLETLTANTITIRRASLSDIPCQLRKLRRQIAYNVGTGFLIEPRPGIALYIDNKGETIIVDTTDSLLDAAAQAIAYIGLGNMTLLRGGLPLHGACLEKDGKRFGLMGGSGSGKSTLSWHLLQQGALFSNDDLIPMYANDRAAMGYPSVALYPVLVEAVTAYYNLPAASLFPTNFGRETVEFFVFLPESKRVVAPMPLSTLFVLQPVPHCSGFCDRVCVCQQYADLTDNEVVSRRLSNKEAALYLLTNRNAQWLNIKWLDNNHLQRLCAEVAAKVPVYELTYRRSYDILPPLAHIIEKILNDSPHQNGIA